MLKLRRTEDRGHQEHGWLESYHTFSFAEYFDPAHHHFRQLRVINEDWVQPGKGFDTHQHKDMEILTYVLEGALSHKDSLGNGSTIAPGEIQRMSAGTGIAHSEFNASDKEIVHLLQIWIFPRQKGLAPGYEQKKISVKDRPGKWVLLASPEGREGSVSMQQDALLWGATIDAGQKLSVPVTKGRYGWLQMARGQAQLENLELQAGDGASFEPGDQGTVTAKRACEMLFFDLA